MVKKTPVWQLVGTRMFETKGEAEKFAIAERKRKGDSGQKTRYEIDMDPGSGQFRVREYYYATDSKGRLV
jgi:hypothetical protein